jgi:hypothetical protein
VNPPHPFPKPLIPCPPSATDQELWYTFADPLTVNLERAAPLGKAIVRDFGSVLDLQNQFNEAATRVFGSGWAWVSSEFRAHISRALAADSRVYWVFVSWECDSKCAATCAVEKFSTPTTYRPTHTKLQLVY